MPVIPYIVAFTSGYLAGHHSYDYTYLAYGIIAIIGVKIAFAISIYVFKNF